MITKERLDEIYENTIGQSLGGIWTAFSHIENFEEQKMLFFECLSIFCKKKKIKFAKKSSFLKGTIKQQISLFKKAFPSEHQMKEIESYWWFLDDCPAGIVWIMDGEIEGLTTPAGDGKYYYWG